MLSEQQMGIGELADAAGLSRRAVRFYVQQQLLPPPTGRGRGNHYTAEHLERLQRIATLQGAGHSLEAIRRILAGQTAAAPVQPPRVLPKVAASAELWTRIKVIEGVELHFNAARHQPEAGKLLEVRDAIREVFMSATEEMNHDATE
jgi:DNA-binding transcriptional MerR regulator